MRAFAAGTWDSPDPFDVACFKHSDRPAKLRLMDGAHQLVRPGQRRRRGVEFGGCTHLSFVVKRAHCVHRRISPCRAHTGTLCSQSCHLGLNNPRCHYFGYLSMHHHHSEQTIHITLEMDGHWTAALVHYWIVWFDVCTCEFTRWIVPFTGGCIAAPVPSMESPRLWIIDQEGGFEWAQCRDWPCWNTMYSSSLTVLTHNILCDWSILDRG